MTKAKGAERPILLAGLPERHYGAILADPPWHFRSYAPPSADHKYQRTVSYETMTIDEIKALPVREVAAPACHLFLWSTGPHLPQALATIEAWGFRYSGVAFTWVKLRRSFRSPFAVPRFKEADLHVGLGFTTRKNAEFCLLARRGNARRKANNVRELILTPVREHSRKPDEAHERIERYCDGPYLELFGRQSRPGWTVRGDEAEKFDAA